VRTLFLLVLLSAFDAAAATANCRDTPGNLLASGNCGFDKDAKGWTAASGASVAHDPADQGVLKAVADASGSLTIEGPCLAVQPATEYRVAARLRGAAGTAYFCSVNVFQYSDGACTEGSAPLASAPGPPGPAWKSLDGSAKTSGTAKSVRVQPVCSGDPRFVVQLDDFVVAKR